MERLLLKSEYRDEDMDVCTSMGERVRALSKEEQELHIAFCERDWFLITEVYSRAEETSTEDIKLYSPGIFALHGKLSRRKFSQLHTVTPSVSLRPESCWPLAFAGLP
jgi:hypothetical protein